MLQQSKIYLNEVIVLNSVNCIKTYETRKLEAHLVIYALFGFKQVCHI